MRYPLNLQHSPDIVITCVDSKMARASIFSDLKHKAPNAYWFDLGNGHDYGQVIVGEFEKNRLNKRRLPHVVDLYPKIIEGPDDNEPSCSVPDALHKQDLFINHNLTVWSSQLLWTMFRKGELKFHGCFVNQTDMTVAPLPIKTK